LLRGEARDDSDVDLIVDSGKPVGLFDFMRLPGTTVRTSRRASIS